MELNIDDLGLAEPRGFTCGYGRVQPASAGSNPTGSGDKPKKIRIGCWLPSADPILKRVGFGELPGGPGEMEENWQDFQGEGNAGSFIIFEDYTKKDVELLGGAIFEVTVVNQDTRRHRAGRVYCTYNLQIVFGKSGAYYTNQKLYENAQQGGDKIRRVQLLLPNWYKVQAKHVFLKTPETNWTQITGVDFTKQPEHPRIESRKTFDIHTALVPPAELPKKGKYELIFALDYRWFREDEFSVDTRTAESDSSPAADSV